MTKQLLVILLILFSFLLLSCQNSKVKENKLIEKKTIVAKYSSLPVNIDGVLDENIWSCGVFYELSLCRGQSSNQIRPEEAGEVMLSYDDDFLYIAIWFQDSDLVAEGDKDQQKHYALGDVCEIFLKPFNETWYWELFVTPAGKKSSFFWVDRSYVGLPSGSDYDCNMKVATRIDGTLNNWHDVDKGWWAEVAIPFSGLKNYDNDQNSSYDWHILIARQNTSRYLKSTGKELSMIPGLSRLDFHMSNEYAILKLK